MMAFIGQVMVDAGTGIVRACRTTLAHGRAEVQAALEMEEACARAGSKIIADRHYDQTPFISGMKAIGMVPHPRAKSKGSQLEGRTTSSEGYAESMTHRYEVEGVFGWGKSVCGMRQTRLRGREKVEADFALKVVAKNVLTIARRAPCLT